MAASLIQSLHQHRNDPELRDLASARFEVQEAFVGAHPSGAAIRKGRSERALVGVAAETTFLEIIATLRAQAPSVSELVEIGRRAHDEHGPKGLQRLKAIVAGPSGSDEAAVVAAINAAISAETVVAPSMSAAYMDLALDIGEVSGQVSLDALGFGETWRFDSPRSMGRALYGVRGSKILQNAVGTHVDELARIVSRATDPAAPLSIGQVTNQITNKWGVLSRRQARVIARTETAQLWTSTQWHSYKANGIMRVRWITGAANVCPMCLANASEEWVRIDDTFSSGDPCPPAHPNCACDILPYLENWLPPDRPWTGTGRVPRGSPDGSIGPTAGMPRGAAWDEDYGISGSFGVPDGPYRKFTTIEQAREYNPVQIAPDSLEDRAISRYIGKGYEEINVPLRAGTELWELPTGVRKIGEYLDSLMAKQSLQENTIVWRGGVLPSELTGKLNSELAGIEFTDKGFASASLRRSAMSRYVDRFDQYGQTYIAELRLPKGFQSYYHRSGAARQMILPRNTQWRVVQASFDGKGRLNLVLEPVMKTVVAPPPIITVGVPTATGDVLRFNTRQEAIDYAKANFTTVNRTTGITDDLKGAVSTYQGSGYREINRELRRLKLGRNKYTGSTRSIPRIEQAIDDAPNVLNQRMLVYRGVRTHDIISERPLDQLVGVEWTEHAFVSTSLDKGSSFGGALLEIELPAGTRGAFLGDWEMEFLLQRGHRFRVISAEMRSGRRVVRCELLPEGVVTTPAVPPPTISFADRVRARINQGFVGQQDAREVGAMVAEEVQKKMALHADEVKALEKGMEEVQKMLDSAQAMKSPSAVTNLGAKLIEKQAQLDVLRKTVVQAHTEAVLSTLAEVRQMGGAVAHKLADGMSFVQRSHAIGDIGDINKFFPTDWINKSNMSDRILSLRYSDPQPGSSTLGVYTHHAHPLTGETNVSFLNVYETPGYDSKATLMHELMHRMEHTNKSIINFEREFWEYRRRTSPWIRPGNTDEIVKTHNVWQKDWIKDKWIDEYMGVRNESGAYELTTRGMEYMFSGGLHGTEQSLASFMADSEHYNFILGLLAGL